MSAELGIRANWRQIALLVVLNGFVGALLGVERTTLPLLASGEFGVASATAALGFIVSFGLSKAAVNLIAGALADRYGRRRVLLAGWLIGLPAPLMVIWAPAWGWVVAANALLGMNQALAWSMTVVMKVDMAGPRRRGLVLGLNEFAGYGGVAVASLAAGYLAAANGLRPVPFLLSVGCAVVGLLATVLLVRETQAHVRHEGAGLIAGADRRLRRVFGDVSWRHPALRAVSQAGLVTNLKDGMAWGLLPAYLGARGLDLPTIALVVAIYPAVWGLGQLVTGPLSDRIGRRRLLVSGMWLQALSIGGLLLADSLAGWLAAAAALGAGTALVYPTFLAAVTDVASPAWRAAALGIFRFWRDLGFAVGAILSGVIADAAGIPASMGVTGAVVAVAAAWITWSLPETRRRLPA